MKRKNVFFKTGILLLSLLLLPGLAGCGAISSLVATPTPTATSTPTMTPTPTIAPTPTLISSSAESIFISGHKIRVSQVTLSNTYRGFVPGNFSEGDKVLAIEVTLLSGDVDSLLEIEAWVTDEHGQREEIGTILTSTSGQPITITWLFAVPETSRAFQFHFASGEVIDLSASLP